MSDHVEINNSPATAFLGIALACAIVLGLVFVHKSWGWHYSACAAICGVFAAVFGAGGTSVHGANQGAIFGWAGATLLFMAVLIFTGILNP